MDAARSFAIVALRWDSRSTHCQRCRLRAICYGVGMASSSASHMARAVATNARCATLRKNDGACAAALTDMAKGLAARKDSAPIVQRCHAGFTMIAAPVRATN